MKRPFFKHPRISGEHEPLAGNIDEQKPLSILDDGVFKAMLTANSEESREALKSLLSACTHREVRAVKVINNELNPPHLDAKSARLDVHVTFNDGEIADLEMQVKKTGDDLKTRAEAYTAMLLSSQTKKGNLYKEVRRVYQIFFLNCVLFPNSAKLPRRYSYYEEEEHDRLSNVTEIIFYEFPKLERKVQELLESGGNYKTLSEEVKWCIFMRYRHEKNAVSLINELCREEEGIMFAEKALTKVSRDYRKYARNMAIIKNSMDYASDTYYKGKIEGETIGYERANLEIARKMKARGHPFAEIAEDTGLSEETVAHL